ncbi:MAG: putative alpha/beta-hydrolase family hydrolase, partial [Arenicella sp.]
MINTLINTAQNPIATFVFAHGAGAGQDSEFM